MEPIPRSITAYGRRMTVNGRHFPKWWNKVEAGSWEPMTFRAMATFVRPGSVVVDLGAWVGLTVLYAACEASMVYGFEPDPWAFERFRENLELNPELAARVTACQAAVGDSGGRAQLFNNHPGNSGSSLLANFGYTEEGAQKAFAEVDVVDGKGFLQGLNMADVSFVKIDIEGGEYKLIPRIAPVLLRFKPTLHLSLHPLNLAGDQGADDAVGIRHAATVEIAEALGSYRHVYFEPGGQGDFVKIDEPIEEYARARPYLRGGWLFTDSGDELAERRAGPPGH